MYEIQVADKEVTRLLDQLLSSSPSTERKLKKIVFEVLKDARNEVSDYAKTLLPNDPRDAHKAVFWSRWKNSFGGNINIIHSRKRISPTSYRKPMTLRKGQVGGNRRKAGRETDRMESYDSIDRGFILNFINAGAKKGGAKRGENSRFGNRGSISAKNWFKPVSEKARDKAYDKLRVLFEKYIKEMTS